MNIFNGTGDQIVSQWKSLRKEITGINKNERISKTISFWKYAPLVNFVLNYNEYMRWPTPWDIIHDNFYDSISIAYLMSQTLLMSGDDESEHEFRYVKINDETDYLMILVINQKYVLNYSYDSVIDISDINYRNCLIKLKYENKKLKEIV